MPIGWAITGVTNIEKEVPTPVAVDYPHISNAHAILAVKIRKIMVRVGIPDWKSIAFGKEKSSINFVVRRYSGLRGYR